MEWLVVLLGILAVVTVVALIARRDAKQQRDGDDPDRRARPRHVDLAAVTRPDDAEDPGA